MLKNTPVKRAARQVHPMDIHVGRRIRQRRQFLGMSIETLAKVVGVSFQQVQKYEIGFNSVSASRLFELAKALDAPPSFFFEGRRLRAKDLPFTIETMKFVRAYLAIRRRHGRPCRRRPARRASGCRAPR
jgi:transcriptional regulator with XRE-family HTH domain